MAKAFDFDGTLYDGDSSIDFWLFAIRHQPKTLLALPKQLAGAAAFALHAISRDEFKGLFFSFLRYIDDVGQTTQDFWNRRMKKIKPAIADCVKPGDYVISASPTFLLAIPASSLGAHLIATDVDVRTGKLRGRNCRGEQKVLRCQTEGAPLPFSECFTDSMTDLPLMKVSEKSYLVTKNSIQELTPTTRQALK